MDERRKGTRVNHIRVLLRASAALLVISVGLACEQAPPPQQQPTALTQATPAAMAPIAAADEALLQQFADDPNEQMLMRKLLEIKQREGRDNAMIHYVLAGKLMPKVPDTQQNALITQVLDRGWNPNANALLPYITSLQPAFQEIRKGAALDYAKNIGWDLGPYTPVPNFLAAQVSAKILCVEGQYFKTQGKYNEALENCLTALTMGRDYGAPGAILIYGLISMGVQSVALDQIYNLITTARFDRPTLDRLLARLQVIEQTQVSAADSVAGLAEELAWSFKLIREKPDEFRAMYAKEPEPAKVPVDDLIKQVDRLEADHKKYWGFVIQYLQTPYWQRDPAKYKSDLEQIRSSLLTFFKGATLSNHLDTGVKFTVSKAKIVLLQVAVGLMEHYLEKGRYPARLADLVPSYLKALPVDPFTGQEFVYRTTPAGNSCWFYSLGPDRRDDGGAIPYDSKDGPAGRGDVFLGAPRSR
jgi:hypothetical protein